MSSLNTVLIFLHRIAFDVAFKSATTNLSVNLSVNANLPTLAQASGIEIQVYTPLLAACSELDFYKDNCNSQFSAALEGFDRMYTGTIAT